MIFNVGHINIQEYARNTDEGADTYAIHQTNIHNEKMYSSCFYLQ